MDTSNRPRAWTDSEIRQLLTGIGPESEIPMINVSEMTDDDLIIFRQANLKSYEKLANIVQVNREMRRQLIDELPLVAIGPESCRDLDKGKGFR